MFCQTVARKRSVSCRTKTLSGWTGATHSSSVGFVCRLLLPTSSGQGNCWLHPFRKSWTSRMEKSLSRSLDAHNAVLSMSPIQASAKAGAISCSGSVFRYLYPVTAGIARAAAWNGSTTAEHFPCRCGVGLPHLWAFSAMKTPLHSSSGIPGNRENALKVPTGYRGLMNYCSWTYRPCSSRNFSTSSAAMQPVPAAVMAWR